MNIYSYSVRHRSGWGSGFGPRPTHCATCKAALPVPPDSGAVGYSCSDEQPIAGHPEAPKLAKGETITRSLAHCYACCADRERADMVSTGRAVLYLVDSQASTGRAFTVQDWAGKLAFPVQHVRKSQSYGFGRAFPRFDVWFTGPDGAPWYGVNKGDSQIVRCKRLKGGRRA